LDGRISMAVSKTVYIIAGRSANVCDTWTLNRHLTALLRFFCLWTQGVTSGNVDYIANAICDVSK
jgi:hypothetical protein